MSKLTVPQAERLGQVPCPSLRLQLTQGKAHLVNLGLICLARGEGQMAQTLTTILQQEGLCHA